MTDVWREFFIDMVELGGCVIVLGAGVMFSLRKAFRYTDAFENETPSTPDRPAPEKWGPTIRSRRLP